jgi:hypothetical protein
VFSRAIEHWELQATMKDLTTMADTTYEKVPLGPPSPALLDSPHTPVTPVFEKEGLKKKLTLGYYKPTKQELEEDPLERLKRSDTVRYTEMRLLFLCR